MATALVAIEEAELDESAVVSSSAASIGAGGLDLGAGQRYSVEALLYIMLLTSSNDAAEALAEHVAGNEAAFVAEMNALVKRLDLADTHFVTPHGLDQTGHVSSAYDLAVLGSAVLDNPVLARIVGSSRAQVTGSGGTVALQNRNLLLDSYIGATGIKTGFTSGAGNVLVASAEREGRRLVAVAMGSADAAADAAALLDFGFARLARAPLVKAGTPVGAIVFDPGGATQVTAAVTIRGMAHPDSLELRWVPEGAKGSVAPGQRVGTVIVTSGEREVARIGALATEPIELDEPAGPARWLEALLSWGGSVIGP